MATANMKDVKRRIKSVESTKQITKAMELVASSKLRKAKERAEKAQPFFKSLYETMCEIAGNNAIMSQYLSKNIVKTCLVVVVAGDSSNDLEMLNPAYYLEEALIEKMIKKYGNGCFRGAMNTPAILVKILDKEPELAEAFIKMPFRGVIVRQNGGENKLHQLEPFATGKYQKIIIVDEGELQSGIKQSIKAYAEQNPKYKEKLSPDLKKQIESEPPKKPPHGDEPGGNGGDDGESP